MPSKARRSFLGIVTASAATAAVGLKANNTASASTGAGNDSVAQKVRGKVRRVIKSTADYGASAVDTPTANSVALAKALAAHDEFIITAGTYNYFTLSDSGKTLRMDGEGGGVIFKVPDGAVVAGATTGPNGLLISGSNITIYGDFIVNGNAANNNASSFPTSEHVAALKITGDNVVIKDTVHLLNPYYIGITVDGGNDTGGEVKGTRINYLKITNPKHYATLFWTMRDWEIGTIEVIAGANGKDQRIRTGTQNSSTGRCLNGVIRHIKTERNVVIEARTDGLYLPSVKCKAFKYEDCLNVRFGAIDVYDAGDGMDQCGFAITGTTSNVTGGDVTISDYNGLNSNAVAIVGLRGGLIKSIKVTGTIRNGTRDCIIRTVDNFKLDELICRAPVGTGDGVWFDFHVAYAPQKNIRIGALLSSGHATYDVVMDSGFAVGDVQIKCINSDAVVQGAIKGVNHLPKGDWTRGDLRFHQHYRNLCRIL